MKVAAMYFFIKKKKGLKLGCIFAALFLVLHILAMPIWVSADEELSLYATAAVLMDADTGRVLYEKNGEEFLANASTTKIMTCILALENADLDEIVEVSAYAASMPQVKLFMNAGEHFVLRDLLYSLMLESHNDSAVAIAEHVGGSMEAFAEMMNQKAVQIGCENTWFITPNGLDATQTIIDGEGNVVEHSHGTTAGDLARIMAYCAFHSPKAEEFLTITRTASYFFSSEEGRSFSCTNRNAFLNMMEGALTGKTGFTNKAGYCYVGALERDGRRFTIALLACGWPNNKTYKWADSKELFTYGLDHYFYHGFSEAVYDTRVLNPVPVLEGQTERLEQTAYVEVELLEGDITPDGLDYFGAEPDAGGEWRVLLSEEEHIEAVWKVYTELNAPISSGEEIGYIRYMLGDTILREDKIVTAGEVKAIDFFWCLKQIWDKYVL